MDRSMMKFEHVLLINSTVAMLKPLAVSFKPA